MPRRHIISLLLVLLVIFGIAFLSNRPAVKAQTGPASEIFQLINQFRASQGLPPFQYNGILGSAAQNHANWMAANVIYSHTGAGGSSPQSRAAGAGYTGYVVENIVGGSNMSPRQGLIWWQNSPIHYNTLVTGRYPQAGVGFASNGQQNMYVLVVGRPPGPYESAPSSRTTGASAAPLIITPIELAEPREDGSIVHVIRPGQAMWTIAAYYDVDLDYLYLINGLTEKDVLQPGDEVIVQLADGQEPPPSPTPPLTHIIAEGESAWSIALQHGIDLNFFYLLNNFTDDTVLHPGNEVIVRLAEGQAPPPTPTPRTTHIVQNGQSLWLIAALYNLTLEQLMEMNTLTAESVIRPGDELKVRLVAATPVPTNPPSQPTATAVSGAATPGGESVAVLPSPNPLATSLPEMGPTGSETPPPANVEKENDSSDREPMGIVGLVALGGLIAAAGAGVYVATRRQE